MTLCLDVKVRNGGTLNPAIPSSADAVPLGDPRTGDLILVFFAGQSNPTSTFVPPSGYTIVGSHANCASSIGGPAAVFQHVFTNGDTLTPTFTISGSSPLNIGPTVVRVRSLSYPTTGVAPSIFSGGDASSSPSTQLTTSTTPFTIPQMSVSNLSDARIVLVYVNGSAATTTTGMIQHNYRSLTATRPDPLDYKNLSLGTFVSTSQYGAEGVVGPSDTDIGSTSWVNVDVSKLIAIPVVFTDGGITSAVVTDTEELQISEVVPVTDPLSVDVSLIQSVTGRGGGAGISVY